MYWHLPCNKCRSVHFVSVACDEGTYQQVYPESPLAQDQSEIFYTTALSPNRSLQYLDLWPNVAYFHRVAVELGLEFRWQLAPLAGDVRFVADLVSSPQHYPEGKGRRDFYDCADP